MATFFTDKQVQIEQILDLIKKEGFNICVVAVETFDNWSYQNYQIHEELNVDALNSLVANNKILLIYFKIVQHNCGLRVYKVNTRVFEYSLWVDTRNLPFLESDWLNESNSEFYHLLSNKINPLFEEFQVIYGAVGIESDVVYHVSEKEAVIKSSNVFRWFFPRGITFEADHYQKFDDYTLDRIKRNR